MSKRKKVHNTKTSKPKINSPTAPRSSEKGDRVTFDFSYKNWLKSVDVRDFTNRLSSADHYSESITKCFYEVIPYIQNNWKEIKESSGRRFPHEHCHVAATEKQSIIFEIIEEVHGKQLLDEDDDFNIWQFGATQGVRLYAIYDHHEETIYPVFIDYHHLIHPSPYFNQPDYSKMAFCPIESYE